MENTAIQPPTKLETQDNNATPHKSNKGMLIAGGAMLIIVAVMLFFLTKGATSPVATPQKVATNQIQSVPTAALSPTMSAEDQVAVSPVPLQTQQDVAAQLPKIDQVNPDAVGTELDQNTADASQF